MLISDENLRGRTVVAADGQTTGEVAAVFIDTSTWTIASLKIKLSKTTAEQLGASQSLLRAATIEIPVGKIQSVGDTVLLSVPTLGLRQTIPEADQQGKVA
jgi:sporulation protein YlmC with PRC-barrel domain